MREDLFFLAFEYDHRHASLKSAVACFLTLCRHVGVCCAFREGLLLVLPLLMRKG